jgi:hypothetical protein
MTKTVTTFQLGETVYNTQFDNFERTGTIVDRDGTLKVESFIKETGKKMLIKLSGKWLSMPSENPGTMLDAILSENAAKTSANDVQGASCDKSEPSKVTPKLETETFEPLSDDEANRAKEIVREYFAIDGKIENYKLRQYELLSDFQESKLYRADYKTFVECGRKLFGINDNSGKYCFYLASIGLFYKNNREFVTKNKLSANAIAEVIVQQNKIAASLDVETNAAEFAAIGQAVIDTATSAGTDGKKVKITPDVIKSASAAIGETLAEIKTEKTGSELLDLAAETLGAKADDILTRTKENLSNTGKAKKKQSDDAETPKNDKLGCELEHSTASIEMLDTLANTLKFECGCVFKLVKTA